jgi:hypothetical protein
MRTISILFVLCLTSTAQAVPLMLQQQGRLLSSSDQPITGTRTVDFSLWDDETMGNLLWTETVDVTFNSGYFSVTLGQINPVDETVLETLEVWLGLTIASEELLPRQRVVSVPYAIHAEHAGDADNLNGVPAASYLAGSQTDGVLTIGGVQYSAIPAGMISIFAGPCPTGWSEYLPLRGRFPRGEPTGDSSTLDAGGDDDATVVSHSHTLTGTAGQAGSHSHGVTDPGHLHQIWSKNDDFNCTGDGAGQWGLARCADNGSYTWSAAYANAIATTTGVSISNGGTHDHSVTGTADATGNSGTGLNRPAFQEVVFCIKN